MHLVIYRTASAGSEGDVVVCDDVCGVVCVGSGVVGTAVGVGVVVVGGCCDGYGSPSGMVGGGG